MRSRSYLFLLLVVGLGILAGFLYNAQDYRFGLDVKGGVRFTFKMDRSKLTEEQRRDLPAVRANLRRILEQRASAALGVQEGTVLTKGEDQFVVELPGYTDIKEAEQTLGTSASIRFYWARNVATELDPNRPYIPVREEEGDRDPVVKFARSSDPTKTFGPGDPEYQQMIAGWELILQGDDLASARPDPQGTGNYVPLMNFSTTGAQKINNWSRRVMNRRENLAAVLDRDVLSIAPLQNNTILRDNAIIQGEFDTAYVTRLTNLLNAGALPVDLTIDSRESVSPSIGQHALDKMVVAGLVAFGVTCLFLLVYYMFPGFVALIALVLYILFTLTVLKWIGATFSLAAIAGFILSVGMAVDANILVFERFKEEMKAGRGLGRSIELGFSRAMPAILDSNACTILTSLVLINLGTGPVKGFATTLMMGVIISLFTAVFVTRSLLVFFVGSGIGSNPKWYAVERSWFGEKYELIANEKPFKIIEKSKRWFMISLLTIIPGVLFMFIGGLKPSVEFQGGYQAQYRLADTNVSPAQLEAKLAQAGFEGARVSLSTTIGENQQSQQVASITLRPTADLQGGSVEAIGRIAQAAGIPAENNVGFTQVGPVIQAETIRNAVLGVIISSALIVFYLAFRFGLAFGGIAPGLRFGMSAIGALVHDVLVVIGIAAIFGFIFNWEVTALFITAMLTVIGFSVHDTIVIFDRIRENLRKPLAGEDFGHLVNRSVTQSFARSLNTSITVIATLAILIAVGTPTNELKFFSVAMLVGILSGTYSSIFNASPILYLWDRAIGRKRGEEHTLLGVSRREIANARIIATNVAPTPTEPGTPVTTAPSGRQYGQVRRRSSVNPSKGHIEIEDIEP